MVTHQERTDLEALAEKDRKSRAPRTAGQAGLGAAFFVAVDYFLRGYLDIDLDPNGQGTEMPVIVAAAFTTITTYLIALYMNRKSAVTPTDEEVVLDDEFV